MDVHTRMEAYETIVARTASILKTINTQTRLKQSQRQLELQLLRREKADLEVRWQRLLKKAADLKRENNQLRKSTLRGTSSSVELSALILGIEKDAEPSEIKQAYRSKAKRLHPDRLQGDEDVFKALTEAMLILMKQRQKED